MRSGVLTGLSLVLVGYIVVPLAFFVSSLGGGEVSMLLEPYVREAAAVSLAGAAVSTVLALVFGVPLAYLLARREFRGKAVVEGLVLMPLVLPPVVGGILLLMSFGPNSLVGGAAESAGFRLTRSMAGVVLAQTYISAPFLVLAARSGFEAVDVRLEQASRLLGKSELETFFRISLPLARRAVVAGAVLTFARAIGEFGATLMMAYYPRTMPVQIWAEFVGGGLDGALPLAMLLLVISLAVIVGVRLIGAVVPGGFDAGAR